MAAFFAKVNSFYEVIEYPIPEGIMSQRFPDRFPNNFDPNNPPKYNEHTPLPDGYVFVKEAIGMEYDWITYNYKEENPIRRRDGFWYRNYVAIERPEEEKNQLANYRASEIRTERNKKLKDTDWTVMPDSPLTESEKQAWIKYRDELRKVPQQPEFPKSFFWPALP